MFKRLWYYLQRRQFKVNKDLPMWWVYKGYKIINHEAVSIYRRVDGATVQYPWLITHNSPELNGILNDFDRRNPMD